MHLLHVNKKDYNDLLTQSRSSKANLWRMLCAEFLTSRTDTYVMHVYEKKEFIIGRLLLDFTHAWWKDKGKLIAFRFHELRSIYLQKSTCICLMYLKKMESIYSPIVWLRRGHFISNLYVFFNPQIGIIVVNEQIYTSPGCLNKGWMQI